MLGLTSNPIFYRALKHDGYYKGISCSQEIGTVR